MTNIICNLLTLFHPIWPFLKGNLLYHKKEGYKGNKMKISKRKPNFQIFKYTILFILLNLSFSFWVKKNKFKILNFLFKSTKIRLFQNKKSSYKSRANTGNPQPWWVMILIKTNAKVIIFFNLFINSIPNTFFPYFCFLTFFNSLWF